MKYKQHRVMAYRDYQWVEAYQGTQGECRTFIKAMRLADRKKQRPVVTRRSEQEWQEMMQPRGSQAASSSPTTTSVARTPTPVGA